MLANPLPIKPPTKRKTSASSKGIFTPTSYLKLITAKPELSQKFLTHLANELGISTEIPVGAIAIMVHLYQHGAQKITHLKDIGLTPQDHRSWLFTNGYITICYGKNNQPHYWQLSILAEKNIKPIYQIICKKLQEITLPCISQPRQNPKM